MRGSPRGHYGTESTQSLLLSPGSTDCVAFALGSVEAALQQDAAPWPGMLTRDATRELARRVLLTEPVTITADPLLLAGSGAGCLSGLLCARTWLHAADGRRSY